MGSRAHVRFCIGDYDEPAVLYSGCAAAAAASHSFARKEPAGVLL